MLNNVNYDIDITKEPPADDTARQYYFIEKAKAYVQRESEELGRPLTFCVTTFGCQMNARDSEKLCGILEKIGYVEAAEDEADFIIFNTCTVRENANMRVYGRLGQLKTKKKEKSSYDDRSLRMHDAGTGSRRKVKDELSLCRYYFWNA